MLPALSHRFWFHIQQSDTRQAHVLLVSDPDRADARTHGPVSRALTRSLCSASLHFQEN